MTYSGQVKFFIYEKNQLIKNKGITLLKNIYKKQNHDREIYTTCKRDAHKTIIDNYLNFAFTIKFSL